MKKNICSLLLIAFSYTVFSQGNSYVITGKITDAVNNTPMQAASVFAQNTTIGTATDLDGNFSLRMPNGGYDLVITFTGYETITRRITTADADDKNLVIALKQKEKALEDVVIKASNEVKDGWEKYGAFFLENFIGKTTNGGQCDIFNKETLKFYFYKKRNRLKVLAAEPIQMENKALGYKIRYTLDSFSHEFGSEAGIYSGYPLFEEMIAIDTLQKNAWKLSRLNAYNGSSLHFMRSVYHKSLKEEGFEIQFVAKNKETETAIPIVNFYGALNYSKDDSLQVVEVFPNQADIAILYNGEMPAAGYLAQNAEHPKKFQLSIITVAPGQSIAIEQNGYYYEQNDITLTGYWTWDKIADMLPYNYLPE